MNTSENHFDSLVRFTLYWLQRIASTTLALAYCWAAILHLTNANSDFGFYINPFFMETIWGTFLFWAYIFFQYWMGASIDFSSETPRSHDELVFFFSFTFKENPLYYVLPLFSLIFGEFKSPITHIFALPIYLGILTIIRFLVVVQCGGDKNLAVAGGSSQQCRVNDGNIDQYVVAKTGRSFSSLAGMHDLKAKLLAAGKEATGKNSQRNGIILHGEPGNGKTELATCLAGELKLPFISVNIADFASKWVNETTERVIAAFDQAAQTSPCVLFIDELDSVLGDRSNPYSHSEKPDTVNAILTKIVQIRNKGVLVIGATNYLDRLDNAGIREGRFDFKIEVPPPDYEARLVIVKSSIGKGEIKKVDLEAIEVLCHRWDGFSCARMSAIGKEISSMARNHPRIGEHEIKTALKSVQGRSRRKESNALSKLVFSDETGHQLASLAVRMDKVVEIEKAGGKLPAGVLLSGPPGTGKTACTRALANDADWAFVATTGPELVRDPSLMKAMFKKAGDMRPAILFIDEADDVLRDRQYSSHTLVTNELLSIMDGTSKRVSDIIVVAATNHPDQIDSAMLRGGRFTEKVSFSNTDMRQAQALFQAWSKTAPQGMTFELDATEAAGMLAGNSHANINAILAEAQNSAAVRKVLGKGYSISKADVERAIDVVMV